MKIAISCYPTYGGSGVMAMELGIALADRGHEVLVYTEHGGIRALQGTFVP
jgi:NADPH-dependent 2,4-dienoyl-CoA reductase/sulfur reductase-like enzyme